MVVKGEPHKITFTGQYGPLHSGCGRDTISKLNCGKRSALGKEASNDSSRKCTLAGHKGQLGSWKMGLLSAEP